VAAGNALGWIEVNANDSAELKAGFALDFHYVFRRHSIDGRLRTADRRCVRAVAAPRDKLLQS